MKQVLAALVLVLAGTPAFGEDGLNLSCDGLPETAVKAVPAPFDAYIDLACTRSGQALTPKPGYVWIFNQGSMILTALNPAKPQLIDRNVHFTALVNAPLSDAEAASLRADLHRIATTPLIDTATIIRMREETSTGAKKQIYLLIPPADAVGQHVLGMECVTECKPIEKDPWFFNVVAEKELQQAK